MPTNDLAKSAEIESSAPQRSSTGNLHHDGQHEPDQPTTRSSRKASTHMATKGTTPRLSNLPSNEDSMNHLAPQTSRGSRQDGLLHIPAEGGASSASRRPADTSTTTSTVWDWDTPLESVGESASYYYEPQGELLEEQQQSRPLRSEFSIPHAVSSGALQRHLSSSSANSLDNFAVPRRPQGAPPSVAGNKRKATSDREDNRPDQKRFYELMMESGEETPSSGDSRPAYNTRSTAGAGDANPGSARPEFDPSRTLEDPNIPMVLPPRKVFPIQIGDKLFRLSGASISSDVPRLTAQLFSSTIYIRIGDEEFQIPRDLFSNPGDSPNYFSLGFAIFFTTPTEVFPGLSQRTLLRPPSILPPSIPNRSAKTFADLLHILKGYPVEIRSEEHRAELLRDARYFHLKGLEQRLIPHSISYNLARKRHEIAIRLEDVRQSGISYVADGVAQSSGDAPSPAPTPSTPPTQPGWIYYQRPYVDGESHSLILEISGDESTFLSVAPAPSSPAPARLGRAMFQRQTLARVTSLFSVIANKMNLPITQPLGLMMMERGAGVASLPVSPGNTGVSEERVKVRIGADADVTVDGRPWKVGGEEEDDEDESGMDIDPSESGRSGKKRKRNEDDDDGEEWVLKKALWRLRVQPLSGGAQMGRSGMEVILGAVKIEAYSNERARNAARGFLT
ncbi:uncharacterized protein LTR77_009686 [Saxophila tyrrhenica]|uniref:Uncharacterized protein n=1 Tax=Saxophila tyrrhenica TaxID=1690608 RepID=A0AAV9NZL0_9PEZI|nr:hypothetical protein LTR77_009686 [Saxophila tyrrhenica]